MQDPLWVQIRVGGSVAAAAAEGSFVVRAMQTLLAAEIREFSGSWADSAFVGLTLIYDHRERQMFRRSEDERGGEASLYHFILSLHELIYIVSLHKLFHCVFAGVSVHCFIKTHTLHLLHLLCLLQRLYNTILVVSQAFKMQTKTK